MRKQVFPPSQNVVEPLFANYNEDIVRNKVDCIFVFSANLEIRCKNESMFIVKLL